MQAFPHSQLHASGSSVGLPHGIIGNSEVGHVNIGAGKIVFQTLPRINSAITNETYYDNETILKGIEHSKSNNSNFHIIGLTSTGNVHTALEHLYATFKLLEKHKVDKSKVFLHCFTDGRDTSPDSAQRFIDQIQKECDRMKLGGIATIIGRYFAMDRNNKWDRTQKAYDLMVKGVGKHFKTPLEAVKYNYSQGVTDEFMDPCYISPNEGEPVTIKDNDTVFCFNYRADRAIQISKAFVDPDFNQFERMYLKNLFFIGMTQYEKKIRDYMHLAFDPEVVDVPIGRVVSENSMRQLRLAETEKFPHVTYFFNGGKEIVFNGEDRVLVPSPKVATYDLKPEMSTYELTQVLVNKVRLKLYDFIVLNFACPDMVGHTGDYNAVVKAVQAVDRSLDKILLNVLAVGGAVLVIADHGNSEVMVNFQSGKPHTEHTTNPVPFIYVGPNARPKELPMGLLKDVAPTILSLLQLPLPSTMNGRNLLEGIV
jgi:2,3-bisphosphoglycerate-independent phosphoglycerate mutase